MGIRGEPRSKFRRTLMMDNYKIEKIEKFVFAGLSSVTIQLLTNKNISFLDKDHFITRKCCCSWNCQIIQTEILLGTFSHAKKIEKL